MMPLHIVRKKDGYLVRHKDTGAIRYLGRIDGLLWRLFRRVPPWVARMQRRLEGVQVSSEGE